MHKWGSRFIVLTLLATSVLVAWPSYSQSLKIQTINIVIEPIFSQQEEEKGGLYQTANEWHINTKPYVIRRLLPFKEGDLIEPRDISEAERILRRQSFLRNAEITVLPSDDGIELKVRTWETWTLFPTVDIKREGGNTDFSYGIQDANLLGHGLGATIEYFSEQERTGYSLLLASNVLTDSHVRSHLILSDNSDGEQYAFGVGKPFYTLNDQWALHFDVNIERKEETIYSNDIKINQFSHDIENFNMSYAISDGIKDGAVWRYYAGFTHDKSDFYELDTTIALPENRDLSYPWIAVEFQQDQFIKSKNLYLIGRTEDVQLGWFYRFQLGLNLNHANYHNSLLWSSLLRYRQQSGPNNLYQVYLSSRGVEGNGLEPTTHYYQMGYEHFYHASQSRTWYAKIGYSAADNPYIDQPIAIGGETGLRGYPLEYQHGNKSLVINLEKRYYPDLNILQLLDVGFVGFVDIGKASGATQYPNQEDGTLISAGIGLRLFVSRSSGRNLINIDFATPLNSDYLSGLDVSVTIKGSF